MYTITRHDHARDAPRTTHNVFLTNNLLHAACSQKPYAASTNHLLTEVLAPLRRFGACGERLPSSSFSHGSHLQLYHHAANPMDGKGDVENPTCAKSAPIHEIGDAGQRRWGWYFGAYVTGCREVDIPEWGVK